MASYDCAPRKPSFSSSPHPASTSPRSPSSGSLTSTPPKPQSNASSIRRKPLPSSALSPTLPPAWTSNGRPRGDIVQSLESIPAGVDAGSIDPIVTEPQLNNRPPLTTSSPQPAHNSSPSPVKPSPTPSFRQIDYASHRRSTNAIQNVQVGESEMGLERNLKSPPVRTNSADDGKKSPTPGSKIGSFFGWKQNGSQTAESTGTEPSENGRSAAPSPLPASPETSSHSSNSAPNGTDAPKVIAPSSATVSHPTFGPALSHQLNSPDDMSKVSQLESELKEITTELAGSIRREIDLEDLVEKLQLEASSGTVPGDRTSDYFSDSGTSSTRLGSGISSKDELDKIKRDADQQRAQIRVELSQKWQEELNRRSALEAHVQILENRVAQARQEDTESSNLSARTRELEGALDDSRKRLAEERRVKENFEDLLTGLKVQLEQHRNERDNLRDEVVPKLRSQIDGLESSHAESQKQTYDFARTQQEIKSLRDKNAALLVAARNQTADYERLQRELKSLKDENAALLSSQQTQLNFNYITEEGDTHGLSTLSPSDNHPRSLSRPNSTLPRPQQESLDSVVDKMKAVEYQREALHSTVKYLLRRMEHQRRQFEKKFTVVESERDRSLAVGSPRKLGYEKDVRTLRAEINLLRKRADDALEQKWQCEKGLAGLKMDLDRSKQETGGLRILLQERDSPVPEDFSASLEQAYKQLQQDQKLVKSSPTRAGFSSLAEEQKLADQLQESAARSEGLAAQVKQQVQANSSLRNRLKDAVERGERNQKVSEASINDLQAKLRKLEDLISSAQNQSETAVSKHEDEISLLRASHNAQLLRAKSGRRTSNLFTLSPSSKSPRSPMFAKRSPRLDQTSTGPGVALYQALKTEYLEVKVSELERALADAEKEMEEVVGRMNMAQIGVGELQSERDEALRQTRKLQAAITAEREKVQALTGGARI